MNINHATLKKNTMTSRERVLAALAHKPTDRVPFSLLAGVNEPVKVELMRDLGFESLEQVDDYLLSFSDFRWVWPKYVGPSWRCHTDDRGAYVDQWGVKRAPAYYRPDAFYMEICEYPLADMKAVEDLDRHVWPSVDWYDFSGVPDAIDRIYEDGEYAIMTGIGNIFERSWYMRGLELMLTDLLLDPELADAIMTRVMNFYIDYFTAMLEAANANGRNRPIDIVYTADDIGGQNGLMFSLDLWEKALKPKHKRLNDALHKYGVKIMYHSDGAIMDALGGLAEIGVDILEALQFESKGMSPEIMKRQFGDMLCFHGGISVQSTLPYGTPDDVKNEIVERIKVLGRDGGYILAPSHAIQAGTPVENVKALLAYKSYT